MRHDGGHEPQSLAEPSPNVGRLEFRDRPLTLCRSCGRVAPRLDEPDCMKADDQPPTISRRRSDTGDQTQAIRHRRSDTGAELRSNSATSLASLTESNPRAMRNRGDDRCGANRPREIITSFLPAHRILLPPHPDPLPRNDPVSALHANSGGEGAKAPLRDDGCGSCFDAIANSLRLMFQLYKSGTYFRTIPECPPVVAQ